LRHHKSGQVREAAQLYEQILARRPDHIDAIYNLGVAALQMGLNDAAAIWFRRRIALTPEVAEAHCNLGNALEARGQLDEAIAAYRQAIAFNPGFAGAHSNLVCALYHHPLCDPQAIAEEQRRWNRQHAEPLRRFSEPPLNDRDPERQLRIGYVSPDFRDHVVGRNLIPLFQEQNRRQV